MFKKALQVATAFGLLVAGYAVYVHVFSLLARSFAPSRSLVWIPPLDESTTAREATERAAYMFGPDSWQTDKKLPIRIYNAERGFWMYAKDYKRLDDGKTIELSPFSMIWGSRDGKSFKTATSDMARIDFDRAIGMAGKPGESGSQKITRARIEGNVELLDDKGTPDRADDLKISRLKHLVYDEKTLQIRSDSDLMIEDGDSTITGTGLLIQLRPKDDAAPGSSAGFNGAQTAIIEKNVHIVMRDVGPAGILPGTPTTTSAKTPAKRGPTPLDLRCKGRMQVDLPRSRPAVAVGPPAPPEPTFAEFFINVDVVRGVPNQPQDSLTCDQLRLMLISGEKPPGAATGAKSGDTASNLTLRRADATGQNVWLVSAAQGIKARCNQLIHKKRMPASPDETYFRGDATSRLVIEKVDLATEGPNKGKVNGYTLIRTVDATIFDDGTGNENSTIVARGPGEMESRSAPDKPVERTARWLDQLTMQPDQPGATTPTVKRLTLTGQPGFTDALSKASLDARRILVVWLAPKPAAPALAKTDPGVSKAGGAFDIQKLVALGDVHLKSPGKTLTARDRLDAEFESPVPTIVVDARNRPAPPSPAAAAPEPLPSPAKPGEPIAERPVEPEARAVSDRVWVKLRLAPATATPPVTASIRGDSGGKQAEIDRVFFRGNVTFHQDPAAGKVKGTDVSGAAVDLFKTGAETSRFIVFDELPPDPGKPRVKAPEPSIPGDAFEQVIAKATNRDDLFGRLAKIDTDELSIRGKVIGLDQTVHEAWVDGLGSLTRTTAAGLLSDKTPEPAKADPKAKVKVKATAKDDAPKRAVAETPSGPITITFTDGMKFLGRSTDPTNRAVAKAEFFGEVHAWTDDSSLDCGETLPSGLGRASSPPSMRLYLDRVVTLTRPKTSPKASAPVQPDDDAKADVALIECFQNVIAVNLKRAPNKGELLEGQRIVCERLTYEKATGKFVVPSEGEVFLYQRDGQATPGLSGSKLSDAAGHDDHRILRISAPGSSRSADANQPAAVIGRNAVRNPSATVRPQPRALPSLMLTQIHFTREMHGRFGSGKATDAAEDRQADFFGDVEVLRAKVPNLNTVLDPDEKPADAQSITAQILRVVSEPNRDPKKPKAGPRNLLRAWEEAYATIEDKTIQADTITYDSLFNVFYAYGEDGKDVLIAGAPRFGQPASITAGRAAMYNVATGEAQLIEPTTVAFVNNRTGVRPTVVKPPKDETKIKRPPRAKFRNPRGNIERKDFTGS